MTRNLNQTCVLLMLRANMTKLNNPGQVRIGLLI